mgnify:CR=1 FL=1
MRGMTRTGSNHWSRAHQALRRAPRERGAAGPVGMIAVFLATAVVITLIMLFATGVAQRSILPRLKNRSSEAVPAVPVAPATATGHVQQSAPDGEHLSPDQIAAASDSLRALRQQVRLEQLRLQEQVDRLAEVTEEIESAREAANREADERVADLSKVLSSMKPQAAARIMVNLDDETFKRVLDQLNVRQAAKALAYIDPVRVARITEEAAQSAAESASVSSAQTGVQTGAQAGAQPAAPAAAGDGAQGPEER